MRKYRINPGLLESEPVAWTWVHLTAEYFERREPISDRDEIERLRHWVKKRVPTRDWRSDGVSRYSYGFWFRNGTDAIAFKLAQGIT